jgi:hypothetical protein
VKRSDSTDTPNHAAAWRCLERVPGVAADLAWQTFAVSVAFLNADDRRFVLGRLTSGELCLLQKAEQRNLSQKNV